MHRHHIYQTVLEIYPRTKRIRANCAGKAEAERHRTNEATKSAAKSDRKIRELTFLVDEEKKVETRLQDLIEKFQVKIRTYKHQVEQAEEVANSNLTKYRQLQTAVVDAEERADFAENSLAKMRARTRASAIGPQVGFPALYHQRPKQMLSCRCLRANVRF